MSAVEVNAGWPQFGLSDELHALYQPDYGVLFASAPGSAPISAPDSVPSFPLDSAPLAQWYLTTK